LLPKFSIEREGKFETKWSTAVAKRIMVKLREYPKENENVPVLGVGHYL